MKTILLAGQHYIHPDWEDGVHVVTGKGARDAFHEDLGCGSLSKGSTTREISRRDAEERGLRACTNCGGGT